MRKTRKRENENFIDEEGKIPLKEYNDDLKERLEDYNELVEEYDEDSFP